MTKILRRNQAIPCLNKLGMSNFEGGKKSRKGKIAIFKYFKSSCKKIKSNKIGHPIQQVEILGNELEGNGFWLSVSQKT